MCAPASVTALHQVLTASTIQACIASQYIGICGVVSALGICFKDSILKFVSNLKFK